MEDNEQSQPGTKRWVRVLLIVSVCLNLAIIGAIGGIAIRWQMSGPDLVNSFFGPSGLAGIARSFSHEDRRMLRGEVSVLSGNLESPLRSSRAQFAEMIEVLITEPFDKTRLDRLFQDQRSATLTRMELGHQILGDRIDSMTPEARQILAERLEGRYKHRRNGRD